MWDATVKALPDPTMTNILTEVDRVQETVILNTLEIDIEEVTLENEDIDLEVVLEKGIQKKNILWNHSKINIQDRDHVVIQGITENHIPNQEVQVFVEEDLRIQDHIVLALSPIENHIPGTEELEVTTMIS